MSAIQLDKESCKKTLQSLSTQKIRILIRQAGGNSGTAQAEDDVAMIDTSGAAVAQSQTSTENEAGQANSILNDRFSVNLNFRSNQFRLSL